MIVIPPFRQTVDEIPALRDRLFMAAGFGGRHILFGIRITGRHGD